jgi:hypothetical protein
VTFSFPAAEAGETATTADPLLTRSARPDSTAMLTATGFVPPPEPAEATDAVPAAASDAARAAARTQRPGRRQR